MGAIKDLVGLVTQLTGSEKDRKFATELKEIQGTLESIQSENAELKKRNASLQQEITALHQDIINLKSLYTNAVDKLPKEAEEVLMCFTKHTDVTSEQVAHQKISALQQDKINLKSTNTKAVDKLPEEAEKVLMLFTKYADISSEQVAHYASLDLLRTEHWLDILEEKNMVYSSIAMMSEVIYYSIAPEGKKYLAANNMK